MSVSEKFSIGIFRGSADEEMFLSVTPGLEHGPGIQRDGITRPRMTDPHCVAFVCDVNRLQESGPRTDTVDPFVQRAGTWTLYHHLKEFVDKMGHQWLVVGVESLGDLTMNPWHIAYLGQSHIKGQEKLCALLTEGDPQEPVATRIYHCFVKWKKGAHRSRSRYEFLDLQIVAVRNGYSVRIKSGQKSRHMKSLKGRNIAGSIEFALAGKPIVMNGVELPLSYAIDKFQDVRHIYNLPTVKCHGAYNGEIVDEVIFGERQLFSNTNERRAALLSPVVIRLDIEKSVKVEWEDLVAQLEAKHYKEAPPGSPITRGQFRLYPDSLSRDRVDIFFHHSVYPFGVVGSTKDGIVCLSSGGLSGRVGNTLEGITRIMFDFFGCEDAMVLDEGYDTFQIANPSIEVGGLRQYKYSNEQMLDGVYTFTRRKLDEDAREADRALAEAKKSGTHIPSWLEKGMREWPLNKSIFATIAKQRRSKRDFSDMIIVSPNRSQVRSVMIFATRKQTSSETTVATSIVKARKSMTKVPITKNIKSVNRRSRRRGSQA
jgi:hypothetical protein